MWIQETLHSDIRLGFKGTLLYRKKTPYQNCAIYQTDTFGRLLMLDGAIQTTEADEYIYHEMLVHPALFSCRRPKDILVIGGGDGGALKEIFKHPVDKVVMVEIDPDVVRLSRKYLSSISKGAFSDRRLELIIADGAKYIAAAKKKFDLVIIDSPDPVGPAKALFSPKFYRQVFALLKPAGIIVRQSGSVFLQLNVLKNNHRKLKNVFPLTFIQLAPVPTYTGGFFSFLVGSKKVNFLTSRKKKIEEKYRKSKIKTKYYSPQIHYSSFVLPDNLKRLVK